MIRTLSLLPELAQPLGLRPAVLNGLGGLVVIVGPNGSGKTRLLDAVHTTFDLAARSDEARAALSRKLAGAQDEAERERLDGSIHLVEALSRPDTISIDADHGTRRPTQHDRCVDLTYRGEALQSPVMRAFPDLPPTNRAMTFAAAERIAPAFLRRIATSLFNARRPDIASRPDVVAALREAERFNELARTFLGKEVSPLEGSRGGSEITAGLGGRRFQQAELASGERMLLAWTILLHGDAASLRGAVVLIDEPETHLHPSLQRQILSSLRAALGEHGQLWVVTHSAEIADRLDVTNLLLLEHGEIRIPDGPPPKRDEESLGLRVTRAPITLPPLSRKLPVGAPDFPSIRTDAQYYVDKTQFIEEVLASSDTVLLFPRPRRFGKTLNLSALRFFVEKSAESRQRTALFSDLRIWSSEDARQHFGRYPVIYLSFKEMKEARFSSLFRLTQHLFSDLYKEHRYLLARGSLDPDEAQDYQRVLRMEGVPEDYRFVLKRLSGYLARYHRERVMILVDEYDTPLHEAYVNGYLTEAAGFLGSLLSAGLKDNPHLFKGVLTGVLRIARESLFSELNNVSVYSMLQPEFATCFGFTEEEVLDLCQQLGEPAQMETLRQWYNGYLSGDQVIFNPWSVVKYFNSKPPRAESFWGNTSSNDLLRKQLFEVGRGFSGELDKLLRGESIHKPIDENMVLRNLDTAPDAVWSLLLFTGYLTPATIDAHRPDGLFERSGARNVALTIPNLEVRLELERLVRDHFSRALGGEENAEDMWQALLKGDSEVFETSLNRALSAMSYHDKDRRTPELSYHMFVLGTAVFLKSHTAKSNRPGGDGRYDLMLIPKTKGLAGVCLEFKVIEKRRGKTASVDAALDAALRQIEERHYTAELEREGVSPIHKVAIVFSGPSAWVKQA